jgi:hypothetical protein
MRIAAIDNDSKKIDANPAGVNVRTLSSQV